MAYDPKTKTFNGYIYKIYNDVNEKVYIGQTITTIKKRYRDHVNASKSQNTYGVILYRAMKKYGVDKFHVVQLCKISCNSEDELRKQINDAECLYIKEYNSMKPNGYNITAGGSNVSDSIKIKVDQYTIDGTFLKTYNSIALAQQSCEQGFKHLIIECCKGRSMTGYGYVWRYHGDSFYKYDVRPNNYGRCKVDCYSLDGKYIKTYTSIGIAAKELGHIDKNGKGMTSKICNCCNGLKRTAYGFVWRYNGESFDKYNVKPKQKHTIINQYSIDNKFINTFNSMVEANNLTHVSKTGITNCCRKKNKTSGGYKWFYASDPSQPDKSKIIPNQVLQSNNQKEAS